MAKNDNARDLELELLQEKLKHLESKISKPQSSEEMYQQRVALYESKAPEREALQRQIDTNRMRLQNENPRARWDEIVKIEAWTRRANELEKTNPSYAQNLRNQVKLTLRDIAKDPFR